jgi:hypothetical protein
MRRAVRRAWWGAESGRGAALALGVLSIWRLLLRLCVAARVTGRSAGKSAVPSPAPLAGQFERVVKSRRQ